MYHGIKDMELEFVSYLLPHPPDEAYHLKLPPKFANIMLVIFSHLPTYSNIVSTPLFGKKLKQQFISHIRVLETSKKFLKTNNRKESAKLRWKREGISLKHPHQVCALILNQKVRAT